MVSTFFLTKECVQCENDEKSDKGSKKSCNLFPNGIILIVFVVKHVFIFHPITILVLFSLKITKLVLTKFMGGGEIGCKSCREAWYVCMFKAVEAAQPLKPVPSVLVREHTPWYVQITLSK